MRNPNCNASQFSKPNTTGACKTNTRMQKEITNKNDKAHQVETRKTWLYSWSIYLLLSAPTFQALHLKLENPWIPT